MTNPDSDTRSHTELLSRAREAQRDNDRRTAMQTAKILQRRGHYSDAWAIFSELRLDTWQRPDIAPAWKGEALAGATLMVADPSRQIVPLMRMARFLGPASARAKRVIAYTDPRLVSALSRSFPAIDIRAHDDSTPLPDVDFVASYDRLGQHLLASDARSASAFPPLVPDPQKVAEFRGSDGGDKLRIGIVWHSSNAAKVMPSHEDWIRFMLDVDAHFVSLQYHEREFGFDALRDGTGGRLSRIDGVDHFHDMDSHLAAIASTDILIGISNTTAHAAGCLDAPFIVLLDEGQVNMHWADTGETDLFFPSAHLLRRSGRPWADIFNEAKRYIAALPR